MIIIIIMIIMMIIIIIVIIIIIMTIIINSYFLNDLMICVHSPFAKKQVKAKEWYHLTLRRSKPCNRLS